MLPLTNKTELYSILFFNWLLYKWKKVSGNFATGHFIRYATPTLCQPIASMMLCTGVEEKRNGEEKQGGEVEGRDGSNGARNQVNIGYTTEVWEAIFIKIMKHKF